MLNAKTQNFDSPKSDKLQKKLSQFITQKAVSIVNPARVSLTFLISIFYASITLI